MNPDTEIWKPIVDFVGGESFEVSNHGRIRNHLRKVRILHTMEKQYTQVSFGSREKIYFLHRIVAKHFVDNDDPDKKVQVDHLDGNKNNDRADNLEWVVPTTNVRRAQARNPNFRKGRRLRVKRKSETEWIEFPNARDAEKYYGTCKGGLFPKASAYEVEFIDDHQDREYKVIPEHPLYEITDDGIIRRVGKTEIMKGRLDPKGYMRVKLTVNKKVTHTTIHSLVLKAWGAPKPDATHNEVNHINGVKDDNRIENLEWATRTQNNTHAARVLGRKERTKQKLFKYDLDGTYLETIEGIGKVSFHMSEVRRGKVKHHQGYLWSVEKLPLYDTKNFEVVRKVFPDFDPIENATINFDLIRPYIIGGYPITQFDIEGNIVKVYGSIQEIAAVLQITEKAVHARLRSKTPSSVGYFARSKVFDIINPSVRIDFKQKTFDYLRRTCANQTIDIIDWTFVRDCFSKNLNPLPRPVWQINVDTKERLKRYCNKDDAVKAMNTYKGAIDQVIRKGVGHKGFNWEWADFSIAD